MRRITVVEDDNFMREELQYRLEQAGYEVDVVTDFSKTVEVIRNQAPDLVLLDLNLPGKNGYAVCKELKTKSSISVLVLTSRDQLKDELQALEIGADEFLTKPCHGDRLLARIRNLEKRIDRQQNRLEGGGLSLDRQTDTLYVGEEVVRLTEQEATILEQLLLHPGSLVSKQQLFQALWGTEEYIDENALQVAMTRLRKTFTKLSVESRIVTVRGQGYQIEW